MNIHSKCEHVLYYNNLKKCIESYANVKRTEEEIKHIYQTILRANIIDKIIEKRHVKYLHNKFAKQ